MRSFRILLGSSDKNSMSMEENVIDMRNAPKDVVGKSELMRPSRSTMQRWRENTE
jgi:hypothetical protein